MTRPQKIAVIIASSAAGLLLFLIAVGIIILQSPWFNSVVHAQILRSVEEATGGTPQMGSFSFNWTHLSADIHDFVIHGLEPSNAAPLFRAKLVKIELKPLSPARGFVDFSSLLVDTPEVNVIVFPDGHTNIPLPKVQKPGKSALATIVDLAIGKFDLRNGSLSFADRRISFNANGRNLVAHLNYDTVHPRYTGELDMNPLNLRSGQNQTVAANFKLPLNIERDTISVVNGEMTTPQSQLLFSGVVEHMAAPRLSAHVNGRVALDEAKRATGLALGLDTVRGPRVLSADLIVTVNAGRIRIESSRMTLGRSSFEGSGTLRDGNRPGSVEFRSTLALGEVGRLLRIAAQPDGTARISGTATLYPDKNYAIKANVAARDVSVRQGTARLSGIALDSTVTAGPHRIDMAGLRLSAWGAGFSGSASLVELAQFRLTGDLRNLDTARVAPSFLSRPLPYDGVLSGPIEAAGNIKALSSLSARANLAIVPGPRGIPVTGRLAASYNGSADTVTLGPSYLALPHTRLDLSGALGRQIQVRLVTRGMSDFQPLGNIPVTFNNGSATLNATITGKLSEPRIAGRLAMTNFAVERRPFTSFGADLIAQSSGVTVNNALLARGPLQAQLSASVGLRNWRPLPPEPLRVDATVRNADLADMLAVAGQAGVPASGAFTADAHITGTIGSPLGAANFAVVNGTLVGQPFDQLSARVAMNAQSIDVPVLAWIAGPSRLDASASYQHSPGDLDRGVLRAHVATNQVQLAQFRSLVKDRPGLGGILSLNGDAVANVEPVRGGHQVNFTMVNGSLGVRGLRMQGKNLGDLTATANTAGQAVQYDVSSNFAGSAIRVTGQSLLTGNHDTTATASIANLPIEQVLAFAGRRDVPVTGVLAANGTVSGTLLDPRAAGSFVVTKGSAYQEPFDRLQASVAYTNQLVDISSLRLTAGPSNLDLSASLSHPAHDFENGQLRFQVRSNPLELGRFRTVAQYKPGLTGTLQLTADGAATLRRNQVPLFSSLNADIGVRALSVDRKPLGDLTAMAATRGREIDFNLKSDLAHSNITGTGRMSMAGNYPIDARLSFANLTYSGLRAWTGGPDAGLEASADGQMAITGSLAQPDVLRASLQLNRLEAHSVSAGRRPPRVNFEMHNAAPIVVAIDRSTATIQSARLTSPFATLTVSGTASLAGSKALNLRADGSAKLDFLEAFSPDVFSSGGVAINAAVTGTIARPLVNGRLLLQNASLNVINIPNGITNASGAVVFNGTQANFENVTGESGGGKITLAGFVAYGGPEVVFRVRATADRVQVAYPENVTTEASAQLSLTGTPASSLLSGTVTISDVTLHPSSDIGSILSQAATPPAGPASSSGLLAGTRLDVRIQTAPDVEFRTTLTANLQADANLSVRGTIDQPGALGRVNITQGDVVFFGNKYTINRGTITFSDPTRINPYLNIGFDTTVQGVGVSLSVTGPMDRLRLSYHSDPPLQFSEIVSLLATGRVPTTDPVLASRQPASPQQSFSQLGASAVLSQAVASPVSGRLQRLFGVSQLSINPQITGVTNTPVATLTLQQQVTKEITFTYIQDVTQSNPQIIRVEWALTPQWSAVAQRDIYGEVGLNFYFKKRFW